MRIAFFHGATIPSRAASTVQVMKMCEAFGLLGHDVLLLSPDRVDGERAVTDVHAHYGVKPLARLARARWPSLPGRQYPCAMHMVWQARRFKADLVYSRLAIAGLFAACSGMRVIHEMHRPASQAEPSEAWSIRSLLRSRRLAYAVTISQALRRLCEFEVPELAGKVLVAHDAADIDFDYTPPDARLEGPLRVGYVGSLYPGRGIELIIGIASECPFAEFHVVGGSAEEMARHRPSLAGLSNVTLHGFQPHPVAQRMLADFDVVLAPYGAKVSVYGAPEADTSAFMSPLKLFEYMAAGKAIICSDHEVLQEVVRDEHSALICERGNVERWAAAVTRLWKDPTLRLALGKNARELCVEKYSWRVRAERVLDAKNLEAVQCC